MKLAFTARIRRLFDRYAVRITIGAIFSLLMHGLILSLQVGLPGIGLPGLGFPWSEQRAQTPELSIRIANLANSTAIEQQVLPSSAPNDLPPKPLEAVAASDQTITDLPNAHVKQAPSRIAPVAPHSAKALTSSPAIAAATRKNGSPPPDDQSTPAAARSQPELIAMSGDHPDTFSVPAPDLDSWWRSAPKIDSIPLPIQSLEEAAPPTIAVQSPKQTIERAQEPAPALQKPSELESFERPDEMKAKEPEPSKAPEVAAELAEHKEGEEIAAQDAVRKQEEQEAAQQAKDNQARKEEEARNEAAEAARQIAVKKLEEEKLAQREQEAAEKKLEEEKQKKQEDAENQAKEMAARKQAEELALQKAAALALQKQKEAEQLEEIKKQELALAKEKQQAAELAAKQQAEELARQKAIEIAKEKQEEQIAALQKAQALAAAQKAEVEAAAQRESARAAAIATAAATAAAAGNNGSATQGNAGTSSVGSVSNQTRALGAGTGNLASRALEQIGKMDLSRIAPNDPDHPEEDTRRHSIFGIVDHDVVVDAYIRGWRNKIERNGNLNYSQSSKDLARENPVVTVSIRSDGSIEDIIFNRSSGRRDIDEAVMRIVRINAPFGKFPENLARKYPIIEIRRVWSFDETLRILEEVH